MESKDLPEVILQVQKGNLAALKELLSFELGQSIERLRKNKKYEELLYFQGYADALERIDKLLINTISG
jgi:hypothetical protein